MKVGIFGTGRVAQTLGSKLVEVCQEVMLGSRNPSKLLDWQSKTEGKAKVGSMAEAAAFGDILINAVKGIAALDALEVRYPMLRGTIRDQITMQRRPFIRFFACGEDLSLESPTDPLPKEVASGKEPLRVVGAMAGECGNKGLGR